MQNFTSEADQIKSLNENEFNSRNRLAELMFKAPIPKEELMNNVGLFIDRRLISRMLFINEMYTQIVGLHGSIIEPVTAPTYLS